MTDSSPKVSFGMPVYNGENYIDQALDSVLNQTFTDFEVIISDNASTDKTEEICRRFAEKDSRIKYYRNEQNVGAAPNYNLTFEHSRGEYFNWFAHDDLLDPRYLEECVKILDNNPDTVLCSSVVRIIDENAEELTIYRPGLEATEYESAPHKRFAPMTLIHHVCTDIFGLFRADILGQTGLHGLYHGCDRALLAEIALMGKIQRVKEPMFSNREHNARYTRATDATERAHWHATIASKEIGFFTWKLYGEYLTAVGKRVPGFADKLRCYGVLGRWWLVNWNMLRMMTDVVTYVIPSAFTVAEKIKNAITKPQHPQVDR